MATTEREQGTAAENEDTMSNNDFEIVGDGYRASELYSIGQRFTVTVDGLPGIPNGAVGAVTEIDDGSHTRDAYLVLEFENEARGIFTMRHVDECLEAL